MTAPFTQHELDCARHLSVLLDEHLGMVAVARDAYAESRKWLFDPWVVLEELSGSGSGSPLPVAVVVAEAETEGLADPAEIAEIWLDAILETPGNWWIPVSDEGVPDQYRIPREAL